jgi:Domain of unknown function (DUF2437)
MKKWLWLEFDNRITFGNLVDDTMQLYEGALFGPRQSTGKTVELDSIKILAPCVTTKMIGLWRNFPSLGAAPNMPPPTDPLYFLKANSSSRIRRTRSGNRTATMAQCV